MSSILCRQNSQKTANIPDASMLKKLIRDPKCRPVLRGILESLLQYLTQDLPKWITRNRNSEKPDVDTISQRNTRNKHRSDPRNETSVKMAPLQTNCEMVHLPEAEKITRGKTAETSSNLSEKRWVETQRNKGNHTAGDLIPRRLTTFQLLQSKFIRSTPKPPISHQREVGTLPSSRGLLGNMNRDSEDGTQNRERAKRQRKKEGGVKDMVAKFAMAEQKEQKVLKKQPVKPRLIGRGILLSSIMEKFETMATVCQGNDLKFSHERSSQGVKVTVNVKEKVASFEREQEGVQSVHKPNRENQILLGQELKGAEIRNVQDDRKDRAHSHSGDRNDLTAEQMGEKSLDDEVCCSLKHLKAQPYDFSIQRQECGENQTAVDEEHCSNNRLKYAHVELLCSASVTEWSFPEPYRLLPQVEFPLKWRVVTIRTCSPVWSMCVDSSIEQFEQEISPNGSECPKQDKTARITTDSPGGDVQQSLSESAAGESSTAITKGNPKPSMKEFSIHAHIDTTDNRGSNPRRPMAVQSRLPKYVIPRVYSFGYQQGPDQNDPSSQLALPPQIINPIDPLPPTQSDTSLAALSTALKTLENFQDTNPGLHNGISLPTHRRGTAAEGEPQERDREAEEETKAAKPVDSKGSSTMQSVRLSEDAASKETFEDSQVSAVTLPVIQHKREDAKQRPKYTTINYGDPSVKQTYKPKVIRFTDTFTF